MSIFSSSLSPNFQGKPEHPLREMLKLLMGGKEPPEYVQGYDIKNLTDAQYLELTEWVSLNHPIQWTTATSTIEAAEAMVQEAVDNGNIPDKNSVWRRGPRTERPMTVFSDVAEFGSKVDMLHTRLLSAEQEVRGMAVSGYATSNTILERCQLSSYVFDELINQAETVLEGVVAIKRTVHDNLRKERPRR